MTGQKIIEWSQEELLIAILQVLLNAARTHPERGAHKKMLVDILGIGSTLELDPAIERLRESDFIVTSGIRFQITDKGVQHLEEQLNPRLGNSD